MSTVIFTNKTPRILFWDDEAEKDKELIFMEIEQGFQRHGWAVQIETDKETAQTVALEEDVDALVLDLKEKNELVGLDILRKVREKKPFLPIVMFTLYSETEYIRGAFKEDISYYLTAPISSYYDVIRAIEVAVERERSKERQIQGQYFASIGKLAAGVAHYLKNALWAINSRSEFLMDKPAIQADEEALNFVNTISKKCGDANKVVANLLNFARREPKENDIKEDLNIVELVSEILNLVSFECVHHRIVEKRYLSGDSLRITGNEFELKEAFLNIVKNAIEAMPDGGNLTVEVKSKGTDVIVKVKDTGEGMNEAIKKNIFLPFFTTKDNSTGFGLFDTRRIIHNHKGQIEVESQLSEGTTITMIFPEAKDNSSKR